MKRCRINIIKIDIDVIKIKIILFFILAMVSNLTVIKHNHPKSKYPTHESGITWQPGSIRQSRHKDAYEKYPGTIRWENHQTYPESNEW